MSDSIDDLGTLIEIKVIGWTCSFKGCLNRAEWEIRRSNNMLPKPYETRGIRVLHYCNKHLPQDARNWFNAEVRSALGS